MWEITNRLILYISAVTARSCITSSYFQIIQQGSSLHFCEAPSVHHFLSTSEQRFSFVNCVVLLLFSKSLLLLLLLASFASCLSSVTAYSPAATEHWYTKYYEIFSDSSRVGTCMVCLILQHCSFTSDRDIWWKHHLASVVSFLSPWIYCNS